MSQTKRGEQFDPAKFGLGEDARFDVIVDETPSSPNQKEATWAAIQPFMDKLPPSAIGIALRASPLPENIAEELGTAIADAGKGPESRPSFSRRRTGQGPHPGAGDRECEPQGQDADRRRSEAPRRRSRTPRHGG
jgi:hypothetical protein